MLWTFGPAENDEEVYADGTVVPHRKQVVYLNGYPVGEVEIHMHRRMGPDKTVDFSIGLTSITYGPLNERERADTW